MFNFFSDSNSRFQEPLFGHKKASGILANKNLIIAQIKEILFYWSQKKKNMSCCMNYESLSAKKEEVNRAKFFIKTSKISKPSGLTVDFIVAI